MIINKRVSTSRNRGLSFEFLGAGSEEKLEINLPLSPFSEIEEGRTHSRVRRSPSRRGGKHVTADDLATD